MTFDFDGVPMNLRAPCFRRLVEHQRQQIRWFSDVESSMATLWNLCESARTSASGKRRCAPMASDRLQQIVAACEEGILAQVSETNRMRLSMEATNLTDQYIAPCLEKLGEFAELAHAEIGLRALIHLAMISVGRALEPELRLPAWDCPIHDADFRAATTVEAWRSFAEANTRRNSRGT